MDNGDKARIDYDMDQLRQNDEIIKTRADHQLVVASTIYDFVNKSMLNIDKKSIDLIEKFQNLKNEVRNELNFTNHIKGILELETELLEVGLWIQNFANHFRQRQVTIIKILMDELQKSDLLTQIISKEELRKELLKAKQTLS